MKRLLVISLIGLFAVSCRPTAGGDLSLIDTKLIGHWKNTNTLENLAVSGNASNYSPATDIDVYFSPDGIVHLSHTYYGNSGNVFLTNELEYKVIDDGILSINGYIIHYEINRGVFTYYNEQNLDLAFIVYRGSSSSNSLISFQREYTDLVGDAYYVSSNSLTKQ